MGRALTWADPRIVELATNNFIAVAGDDWYQRRREDAEGEFFRQIANQGPRKGQGGGTRQGIYVFSAGGTLLGYRNHQDPNVMRQFLVDALKAWQRLPAKERVPGAVTVAAPGKVDPRYHREPPAGGAIVNVYTRILDRDGDEYVPGSCKFPGGDMPAHDHLWIYPDELASLLPAAAKAGDRFELPARLAQRLARFHLIDNTRGEPPFWSKDQLRSAKATATVEKVTGNKVDLKVEGHFLLSTAADPKAADRGYDVHLLGLIRGDRAAKTLERFDLVALGDHWGEGTYTRGARPGRTPLGVAFELTSGERPADRVPPQAAREINAYRQAER